jgi:hypothetical protein
MAFYIGNYTSSLHQTPHPLWRAKGISNKTSAPLSSLNIFGVPDIRELAYDGYYRNIDCFISATSNRRYTTTSDEGAPLDRSRPLLPLPTPAISFRTSIFQNPDQRAKFCDKFVKENPVVKTFGKSTQITFLNPTVGTLDKCKVCINSALAISVLEPPLVYHE